MKNRDNYFNKLFNYFLQMRFLLLAPALYFFFVENKNTVIKTRENEIIYYKPRFLHIKI